MEKKPIIQVSHAIYKTIDDEQYKNARVLIFDENNNLIVNEELEHILFKTYKMLNAYELTKWTTDYHINGNEEINILIIFAKKILKGE